MSTTCWLPQPIEEYLCNAHPNSRVIHSSDHCLNRRQSRLQPPDNAQGSLAYSYPRNTGHSGYMMGDRRSQLNPATMLDNVSLHKDPTSQGLAYVHISSALEDNIYNECKRTDLPIRKTRCAKSVAGSSHSQSFSKP